MVASWARLVCAKLCSPDCQCMILAQYHQIESSTQKTFMRPKNQYNQERMSWQSYLNNVSRAKLRPIVLPNTDCSETFFESKLNLLQIILCWSLFSNARWCLKLDIKKQQHNIQTYKHKNMLMKKQATWEKRVPRFC